MHIDLQCVQYQKIDQYYIRSICGTSSLHTLTKSGINSFRHAVSVLCCQSKTSDYLGNTSKAQDAYEQYCINDFTFYCSGRNIKVSWYCLYSFPFHESFHIVEIEQFSPNKSTVSNVGVINTSTNILVFIY